VENGEEEEREYDIGAASCREIVPGRVGGEFEGEGVLVWDREDWRGLSVCGL
jgi:hypothetical protein